MARKPRIYTDSGIYHVILRGNNRQVIFEDDEDRRTFLYKMKAISDKLEIEIYAYCLMDNHVHILLRAAGKLVSEYIKRLSGSYAYWYNRKYDCIGHLFQERFKSEPVENKKYFLIVLRYIHCNPVKAGIVKECGRYDYSSYHEYVGNVEIVNKDFALSIMDLSSFIMFHNQQNDDNCIEIREVHYKFLTDSAALKIIKNSVPTGMVSYLNKLSKEARNKYIRFYRKLGMSINQISRLTGIGVGIISRQKVLLE